jgi:nucleoid-associated protein YgaU
MEPVSLPNSPLSEDLILRMNNPYHLSEIRTFDIQESILESFPIHYKKSPKDRYYTVDEGDNFSDISFAAYGDSKYWWVIYLVNYNINPELDDPFYIKAGTSLIVPDLEIFNLQNNA